MNWIEMFEIIKRLEFEKPKTVFNSGSFEIYLVRPNKVFKNYDKKKNFQIFIKNGNREFRPNHLRVFIDLNLRVRSRPDKKEELLKSMDKIFYKKNSINSVKELSKTNFKHSLNPIQITGILSQLFLIEQEYNYTNKSKYKPKTLFYQGWVRQFLDSPREIDNLCMSVCNRQTPLVKYTKKEDENHKEFSNKNKYLWYLE